MRMNDSDFFFESIFFTASTVFLSEGYPLPRLKFLLSLWIDLSRLTFAIIDAAATVTNLLSAWWYDLIFAFDDNDDISLPNL